MANSIIPKYLGFQEFFVNGTNFSFQKRHAGNEGWLVVGESGLIAPIVFMVGYAGNSNQITINKIVDPYGLTITGTISEQTITITFDVSVSTIFKVFG